MTTATLTRRHVRRAAVVDDEPQDARAYARILEDFGMTTTPISKFEPGQTADGFLANLLDRFDVLVCDHVLHGRTNHAGFTGAELVCKANMNAGRPLPAVLISSHIDTDQSSIREWREGIPQLVDKSAASGSVVDAIDRAFEEANGIIPRERRAFKTPIEVIDVVESGEAPHAIVVVVGWQIDTHVKMPLRAIQRAISLGPRELPGQWLQAEVNCYAMSPEDLFYRNIALAPDLPIDWAI